MSTSHSSESRGVAALAPAALSGEEDAGRLPLGPWNPGITSTLPRRLYPRVTIFEPGNGVLPVLELEQLAAFCGLPMPAIAELGPERLILHELLVRVMAELSIDDGPLQQDLGANFRRMVSMLYEHHVQIRMAALIADFSTWREDIVHMIENAFRRPPEAVPTPAMDTKWNAFQWVPSILRKTANSIPEESNPVAMTELELLQSWQATGKNGADAFTRCVHHALTRAASAVISRQGAIAGREAAVKRIAVALAVNELAGGMLGRHIDLWFFDAVAAEGFKRLPSQPSPIVMNTKGASAAGKSTLRPKQRLLAERIGADWTDFAIISPDIWRKQLLDYASLGADRRWAGTLTSYEVEIIDRKLDRYIAMRAAEGRCTHMLIDRFRFDSFAPEGADDSDTQLLTRFGSEVYMFFMITPPEATVDRSWTRGERVGRYKAVDDLLAHNVDAFSGMPNLFFRWIASKERTVHFEFLDNGVAEGQSPRTVAFGRNNSMIIVDLDRLFDIDRFRRINVEAKSPSEVYVGSPQRERRSDSAFFQECIKRIPRLTLAEHSTGCIYAEFERGRLVHWSADIFNRAVASDVARASLASYMKFADTETTADQDDVERVRRNRTGRWGPGAGHRHKSRPKLATFGLPARSTRHMVYQSTVGVAGARWISSHAAAKGATCGCREGAQSKPFP